jgi:hypothetical protein
MGATEPPTPTYGDHQPALDRLLKFLHQLADLQRGAHRGREAWRYDSFAELVLDLGRVFIPAPFPDDQQRGYPGQCFRNAARYADVTDLTYVEGVVLTQQLPFGFDHAWTAAGDGRAVDPSLPDRMAVAYIGVPVTPVFRKAQQAARNVDAVFAQAPGGWTENDEVLRTGVPAEALVDTGGPLPQ